MNDVAPFLQPAAPLDNAERARADFEPARRYMLAALRECVRAGVPEEELREEADATHRAMRQIIVAGGWR